MIVIDASKDCLYTQTDDTLRETISHGDSRYPLAYYLENIWEFDFHCVNWHWHHELEFLTVAEGTVLCLVGEEKIELSEGCGLFVNSGVLHRYEASDNCLMPNIVFSPALLASEKSLLWEKYIQPLIDSATACQIFRPEVEWQRKILEILADIYALQESSRDNELRTVQLIFKMWELLYAHLDLASGSSGLRHISPRQARLQIMMQYIHDHYSEQITLGEIAAAAAVSKSGALHIFHAGISLSPVSYLIQYRLLRAAELLHTTEKPVSAIAEETGFTSAGYFCRKFKERYQMSPNTYRKKKA